MKTIIYGYPDRQTSKHKKIIGEKQQPIDCQDCRGWPKGSLGAREDSASHGSCIQRLVHNYLANRMGLEDLNSWTPVLKTITLSLF